MLSSEMMGSNDEYGDDRVHMTYIQKDVGGASEQPSSNPFLPIILLWSTEVSDDGALPPCHMLCTTYKRFSCTRASSTRFMLCRGEGGERE